MDRKFGCPFVKLWVEGAGSDIARGGEPAHDATVTMYPFRNCLTPSHRNGGGGGVS